MMASTNEKIADGMRDAIRGFTDAQKRFMRESYDVTQKEMLGMENKALFELYDELCEDEIDAYEREDKEFGEMVASIVTVMGNAIP